MVGEVPVKLALHQVRQMRAQRRLQGASSKISDF
jgi:hypothetical protein